VGVLEIGVVLVQLALEVPHPVLQRPEALVDHLVTHQPNQQDWQPNILKGHFTKVTQFTEVTHDIEVTQFTELTQCTEVTQFTEVSFLSELTSVN
jgi:hypothetical protein